MSIRISLAALLLALTCMLVALSNPLSETYLQRELFDGSLWRVYLDLNSNAFFVFRKEPALAALEALMVELAGPKENVFLLLCYLSFFFGSLLFFYLYASGRDESSALLGSFFVSVTLYFLFGNDPVTASSLAWFPWLALLITSAFFQNRPSALHYLLIFFFALRLAKGANQLSMILIIFAIGVAFLLTSNRDSSPRNVRAILFSIVLAFLPAFFIAFQTPETPYPDYHSFSRVHAYDGTVGMARPHIGPSASIPVIDRNYIQESYSWLGQLLIVLFAVSGFALRKKLTLASTNLLWGALTLCLAIIVDTSLPAQFADIGPLATLGRILPHLYFLPLTPIVTALGIWLLFYFAAGSKTLWASALLSVLILICGAIATSAGLSPGILSKTSHLAFGKTVKNMLTDSGGELERYLISPSLPIYRLYGPLVLTLNEQLSSSKKISAAPLVEEVSASTQRQRRLGRLLDHDPGKRWTSGKGRQSGDEWVYLKFKEELKLFGLHIETGAFASDFPRGLSIYYQKDCEFNQKNPYAAEKEFINAYNDPIWKGSLRFTSDGYPYYGGQHHVEVYFLEEITARCVFIRQTGKTPHFDWSITGINLIVLKEPK